MFSFDERLLKWVSDCNREVMFIPDVEEFVSGQTVEYVDGFPMYLKIIPYLLGTRQPPHTYIKVPSYTPKKESIWVVPVSINTMFVVCKFDEMYRFMDVN